MRSSKNRSRSKGNRNRSVGNIVNRVFDSSGPEGKVRGTPQQIIDKYNQLARDAQLGNDRVATENFQQHAEHYTRMLAEAQREQDARREQQQQQQNQNQNRNDGQNNGQNSGQNNQNPQRQSDPQSQPEPKAEQPSAASGDQPTDSGFDAVIETKANDGSGLVETPETAPKPKRTRTRRPRKSDAAPDGDKAASGSDDKPSPPPQEAAE